MSGMRKSAEDRSFMNKVYKPVAGYVSNAKKEVGQAVKAWNRASNAAADYTPGANARANKANAKQKAEFGQAVGAIVKGAKYDSKGKRTN